VWFVTVLKRFLHMLEGCVTVLYAGTTMSFALLFLTVSILNKRSSIEKIDSLWRLMLAMFCFVYIGSMLATLAGKDACKVKII